MDRRSKSRIDVQLTCYVSAGRIKGEPQRTLTENVSRTGILMRWMTDIPLPKINKKLILDVSLPENSDFGPRVMRCRTQVIRIVPVGGVSHDVALRVLSMRFMKRRRVTQSADLLSMPVAAARVS